MRPVRYKKGIAVEMRKQGFSYAEIGQKLFLPKSTLSLWLKKVSLTPEQRKKLDDRRIEAARTGSEKKSIRTSQLIQSLQNASIKDVQKISKRELWLMGIVLYWRERFLNGSDNDLRKGVRFTSSDPDIIKLFLTWLQQVGGIQDDEIMFDIFIGEDKRGEINDVIGHWSKVVGSPRENFSRIYFQKVKRKKSKRKISNKSNFGLLRIRVKASSTLARQISGWVKGIRDFNWN
ncbi:MAG: hypothetical protein Q8P35_01895 [Candidatus Yanofskybacteria bacterium]|nr:hypothetical protein [Candidatus Yanofskybacteria bacterium]